MDEEDRISAALLDQIGRRLYGEQYRPQLAAALNVSLRSVQNWLQGKNQVPLGVKEELRTLCRERAAELLALVERL